MSKAWVWTELPKPGQGEPREISVRIGELEQHELLNGAEPAATGRLTHPVGRGRSGRGG